MKAKILSFIDQLLLYDYLLFGGIILVFILLLILAIVLRHRIVLAIVLVFIAFGILTAGSFAGYKMLHHYLFSNTITLTEVKALEFTEALLIKGDLNNTSKRPFKECKLSAGVYKVTHNRYVDRVYPYLPFRHASLTLKQPLKPGETESFKLFVEPFRYNHDFNVTIKADCR